MGLNTKLATQNPPPHHSERGVGQHEAAHSPTWGRSTERAGTHHRPSRAGGRGDTMGWGGGGARATLHHMPI